MTGVLGQDPDQHDGVILYAALSFARTREVFAYSHGGFFGCIGAGFGGFDNGGEMEVVIRLRAYVSQVSILISVTVRKIIVLHW